MASRRDQLHSYQFINQRVINAFVMRETDPAQSPLRRGLGAVFAGVMIAILVAAGFGIYGLLTKVGGNTWQVDGTVVVEKETGASFVYIGGILHPALNYTSALLAAGRPTPTIERVSGRSLAGVPRGVMVGIPGAPNSLPNQAMAVGPPWTLCSSATAGEAGPAGTVSLAIGVSPIGANRVGDGVALLVTDPTGTGDFLIWHGHRYALRQPQTVVPALFGAAARPAPVGSAWLNALPAGVDIAPIAVPEAGQPSPTMPGRNVGDLLVANTGAGPQFYVVMADGAAPITVLQKDILVAQLPVQPIEVSLAQMGGVPVSQALTPPTGEAQPPATPPTLVAPNGGDMFCAQSTDPRTAPSVWTGGTVAQLYAAAPTGYRGGVSAGVADRVLVPPGRVAVVRAVPSPEATSGGYYIVTDLGIRYAVPSDPVLNALGYTPANAVNVLSSLVNLIPSGPALDPNAPVQPVPMSVASGS
jgi:type VII secretion protein EccB